MSIKKLFDKGKTSKVVSSTDLQKLAEDVESTENIKQRFEDINRFIPSVDFANPEKFARFASAEKYYTDAMDRIVRQYPYDGSEAELNEFFNESNYIDRYIFDNLYPRTTGYAKFGRWGDADTSPAAVNLYYGESTTKEYIEIRGGPHTASYGMPLGSIGSTFTGSNYYSTDIYNQAGASPVGRDGTRESNLRMNLDDGITIEFWLKKEQFIPSKTRKEVVFDLWNQVTSSSPQYGRLTLELTSSLPATDIGSAGASPFVLTFLSGGVVQDNPNGSGFERLRLGGATVTTASIADNKWHHYAFSIANERAVENGTIVRFYRDGNLVSTTTTGSVAGEVTGSLIGFIGALQAPPSSSAKPADNMVGWGKLSGSIDDFRYWKARRTGEQIRDNYFTQVRGGTNTDVSNAELGVYYKFNEGITGDDTLDATVLDYSGRMSNGIWVGYSSTKSRSTGSAIIEYSGSNKIEYKDPIIYPSHPDVESLRDNLVASASYHDIRNNTSLYHSMPSWIIDDDDENAGQLKNLTQIIGNYFDTLYLQIEAMKDLHVPTYQTSSGKALPFSNRLLESKGFINSEIFANAEVLEAIMNRDDHREFSDDLHNVKNLIYQNIYNNLVHIFKTKGTEKSFQNLIRSFGVDEELIRINLYADNTTQLLRDNFRPKAVKKNFVDFYQSDNQDAVVTHDKNPTTATTAKNPDAVGVTYISASHKDIETTAESEIIFPRLKELGDIGYTELNFVSSSLFGWDQADPDPDNYTKPSNGSGYQVLAVRPEKDSKDAWFYLVDRSNNATVATSSLFKNVYDDQRWTFALRTRNVMTSSITPSAPNASHGMGTFLTGAAGIRAKATITVIDSSSPPGVPFIGEGDTIQLISTDGTTVTLTMQGTSGTTTSSETSGETLTAKTLSAGSYANSTLHATAQAVEIRTAINNHTKFIATNTANVISIVQAEPGTSGNTTLTITELGATGMSNTNFAGGANAGRVEISLYGVHTAYDRIQEEFALSGTAIHSDITVPRRYYVGARRENIVGSIQEYSGVKAGYLRHWQMYIDNKTIQAHARDTENYGTRHPFRSAYLLENALTGVWIPEYKTLALNWDFSNVTGSDASGEFTVQDFTSGSSGSSDYTWGRRFRDPDMDSIVRNQYNARGYFFKTNTTAAVDTNYISSARYRLPEVMNSQDMVEIRNQDDLVFTKESRPISHFFAFEKSMYQTISEEMINMFAGITEFNNLIGEPVNKYRHEYKDIGKLRQIFYERVENTPDLDKYLSYYKWLDTALGEMLQQLVPASSRFSDDIRNVIEDTVLTRNKYRHILPTLRTPDIEIEGQIKGIHEHIYNWRIGHAPLADTAATATWTFTDKPNEETTITIADADGTSVVFEVDNATGVGDGVATAGATPMDPATNNAAGMGDIMASVVNASALKITATTDGSGKVTLTQDIKGERGNTVITLSNYSNWNYNTSDTFPTSFTGGSTPENKNCLWWKQRAERGGITISSNTAGEDPPGTSTSAESAAVVKIIDEQRDTYKRTGYSFLSASVPQFTTLPVGDRAFATITVADGDAASGMTEKEHITIISTDGTSKRYVITDADKDGDTITGTVLSDSENTDTGAGTAGSDEDGGVAVSIDLTGTPASQNDFLVGLKKAIEHENGHNGKIIVTATPDEADGNQSITLYQSQRGASGNTTITTDISQITESDFIGGTDNPNTKVGVNNVSIHTGSYYPNNRFSRVYRLFVGTGFNSTSIIGAWNGYMKAGHNPAKGPNSKYTYWRNATSHADLTKLIEVTNIIDESGCEDEEKLPIAGTFPSKKVRPGGVISLSATSKASPTGKANNLPFSLYKSDVTTGYKASISNVNIKLKTGATTAGGFEVNNLHQDVIETGEASMQGPFTEKYVGGLPHRHVDLNTTLDNPTNRVEGFVVVPAADSIQVRAPSAASDDRGSSDPEVRGDFYRNVKTKRPVNIRNIRQLTGSSQLNHIGNFTSFREIVQISDRDANNRAFVKHEGKGPFLENSRVKRKARGNLAQATIRSFAGLGEFKDVAKPNFYISGSSHRDAEPLHIVTNPPPRKLFAESNRTDFIIVERFSAPGGPETAGDSMGGAALDYGSAQYSPYNNINYRNLSVRLPLRRLLTDHAAQFGYRSDERHRDTPIYASSEAISNQYIGGVSATATITIIDSGSPPGVPFIGEGDTIELVSTDGTKVTLTMQGTGGTTTSSETSGTTLTAKTLSAGSYANTTLHATAQAVEIRTAINNHTKFTATNNANIITIVQAKGGVSGNTTLTITELGATGMSNTNFTGGSSQIPAFHNVNRNSVLRHELSSSRTTADTVIRAQTHDNYWVSREIPQSDTQYAWITASLAHEGPHLTTVLGHPHPDGMYSSSVAFNYGLSPAPDGPGIANTDKTIGPGYIPALNFCSASDVASFGVHAAQPQSLWLNYRDKKNNPSNESTSWDNIFPTDFVGMNGNIRQVIDTGSLTLSGSNSSYHGPTGLTQRTGIPSYRHSHLYANINLGAPSLSRGFINNILVEQDGQIDATILNHLNLNRNGPYGYPTWKQIRTGETRIGRYLRRNNIITYNETPGRHLSVGGSEKVERFGALKKFREPALVSRYKPVRFTLGMKATYDDRGKKITSTRPVTLRASVGNELNFFSDPTLDNAKGFVKSAPIGYRTITDFYLRGGLGSTSTPIESFIDFTYAETVYPKEVNTYMKKSRARNLYANNFWKDGQIARRDLGQSKPSFAGQTADDPDPITGENVKGGHAKRSSWNLDGFYSFAQTGSATFASTPGSETGILQEQTAILHHGNKQLLTASCFYARPHLLGTTASIRSLTGPEIPETGSTNQGLGVHIFGKMKVYGGVTAWEAGDQAGFINDAGEFVNRPTAPFYNSYEDYSDDLRSMAKDYSVVPEFRISEHIDFYVKKKQGNFLAQNPKLLSIAGSPTASSVPQNSSEDEFFKIYSTSDFMKHFGTIRGEHKEFCDPTEITLTCKAAMKFLPYNGFYPSERTVEIATQFSSSYMSQCVFAGDDKTYTFAKIRPLITPLFAPGVLFNTIKSGIAVDFPVYTGSFKRHNPKNETAKGVSADPQHGIQTELYMIATASNPRQDSQGKLSGWDLRVPFETLVEPEKYITNIPFVDMEVHPSSAMDLTASWSGQGDDLYKMMSSNFLAAVPEFFLPAGEFATLKSKPQRQFESMDTGSIYGMRIKIRKSYHRGRQMTALNNYFVPQNTYSDAVTNTGVGDPLRETFTMYSRPSAFGPPVSGRYHISGSNQYQRRQIADSLLGLNPAFTPPYYDGEAWCDVIFQPSSSFVTLGDILADSKKLYWRFDKLGLGNASNNTHPYGNLNINKFSMQMSSSFNLFQKVIDPSPVFDKDGNILSVGEADDANTRWVIQPKFETPMYNFADSGVHPISNANGTLQLPINNSESIARGMWHQFGVIPKDTSRGIFLEVDSIPQDFIENRVPRFASGTYDSNHTIDPNSGRFDDTSIKGAYGGGQRQIKSLLDVVTFENRSVKLGQTALKKKVSEAVVAVPFIEEGGKRKFFNIDKSLIQKVMLNPRTDEVGHSIKNMVSSMKKFIVPPTMDFVTFPEDVDPISMYFFEFEFEFDQSDLQHMWQNLMPPSGKIVKMSETKISHKLLLNEIFGNVRTASGQFVNDKLKWMVFKVKQRANANYFSKVAGFDQDSDTRFRSIFKSGRSGTNEEKELRYSYNWPYDFFSMVELIKMESEIKFTPSDIDPELITEPLEVTEEAEVALIPKSSGGG